MFRKKISFLLGVTALAFTVSSAQALEEREFKSADGTQSFKGTAVGFDAKSQKVSIRNEKGGVNHAKLSAFSEADIKYIKDNANVLAAASALDISFNEVNGEGSAKTGYDTGYDIRVQNRGKDPVQDIEVKYAIYYLQGSVTKGVKAVPKTHTGSLDGESIFGSLRYTVSTDKVRLVREVLKRVKGGG